jgi:dynein heavy chain
MLWIPELTQRSMEHIFNSILKGFLMPTKTLDKLSYSIVKSTIDIYFKISKDLLPTPAKCHYTFNLRDVAKVF